MRSHACHFDAIDILHQHCIRHCESGPRLMGIFPSVTTYTLMYILTKFQLYNILFGVKPPERLDYS